MKAFSEKLLRLRTQNRLSQEDVADKLGVSRQSVQKWESNQSEPGLQSIVALSRLFDVSCDFLLRDMEMDFSIEKEDKGVKTCLTVRGEVSQGKFLRVQDRLVEFALTDRELPVDLDMSGTMGLLYLPNGAFADCTTLRSVRLPEGLKLIGGGAFKNCNALTDLYLPSTLVRIAGSTLLNFIIDYAKHIEYAKSDDYYDYPPKKNLLNNVYFAGTMADWFSLSIQFEAPVSGRELYMSKDFFCKNLYIGGKLVTELSVPEGTEVIGEDLLLPRAASVKTLHIPKSVKKLPAYLQYYSDLYYEGSVEEWLSVEGSEYFEGNLYIGGTLLTEYSVPEGTERIMDKKTTIRGDDGQPVELSPTVPRAKSLSVLHIPKSAKEIYLPQVLRKTKDYEYSYGHDNNYYTEIHFAGTLEQWLSLGYDCFCDLYIGGTLLTEYEVPEGAKLVTDHRPPGVRRLHEYADSEISRVPACKSLETLVIPASCEQVLYYSTNTIFKNTDGWYGVLDPHGTIHGDYGIFHDAEKVADAARDGHDWYWLSRPRYLLSLACFETGSYSLPIKLDFSTPEKIKKFFSDYKDRAELWKSWYDNWYACQNKGNTEEEQ